jgi:hypothetical protein
VLREHACRSSVSTEQEACILSCVAHSTRPLRLIELGSPAARMAAAASLPPGTHGNADGLRRGKELARVSCGRLLGALED